MNALWKVGRAVVRRGMLKSVQDAYGHLVHLNVVRENEAFDRRFGSDTQGIHEAEELEGARAREENEGYEAARIDLFHALVRRCPVAPSGLTFVDIGSGKGRAVMLAALSGFKRVVGVELSPPLHALAERNICQLRERVRHGPPISLHLGAAEHFDFPHEPLAIFLYNPFRGELMVKLVQRLEQSFRRCRRELVVLYLNPVAREAFDRSNLFELVHSSAAFCVYRARDDASS